MADHESAGATRGADPFHNEDRFLAEDKLGLYLVCDGLSDRPGGERAAAIAADAVEHYLESIDETRPLETHSVTIATVESAIEYALQNVVRAAEDEPELAGMASTLTLLIVQSDRGFVGHVGDSRAYLVRRGRRSLLTMDQELTETDRDVLPATEGGIDVQTFSISLRTGDTVVLCTDGAEDEMEDSDFVRSIGAASPAMVASRIVSRAQRTRPGHDATCVVVRVLDDHEHAWVSASDLPEWLEGVATLSHDVDRLHNDSGRRARFNPALGGRGRGLSPDSDEPRRGPRSGLEFA